MQIQTESSQTVPNHTRRSRIRLPAALIAATLTLGVLTACGDDDPGATAPAGASTGTGETDPSAPEVGTEFNRADVAFAQGMIPHHVQAVEMAELAEERAAGAEVMRLAEQIEAAQQPEIELMTEWLRQWGAPVPDGTGMAGMDHGSGGHAGMAGMMTADQMSRLRSADGEAFDRLFLELMIDHHRGAIEMAETELAEGENAEAKELAQQIIETQRAEIDRMRQLLGR